MKKILAMAAAAALTCGVSAYAANPFSDVSAGDWAYQAVTSLSEQGVVEGYPDGTFKGQQNMTRYEMAQIIARMLAKEDQYNAEQRAMIDRLASEYADELNNLGAAYRRWRRKWAMSASTAMPVCVISRFIRLWKHLMVSIMPPPIKMTHGMDVSGSASRAK